jgi:hypothetical protein
MESGSRSLPSFRDATAKEGASDRLWSSKVAQRAKWVVGRFLDCIAHGTQFGWQLKGTSMTAKPGEDCAG